MIINEEQRIRNSILRLANTVPAPADRHISGETLVDYVRAQLSAPDAREVQDHLLVCGLCRELLLDVAEHSRIASPEPDASCMTELKIERALQSTLEKLSSDEATDLNRPEPQTPLAFTRKTELERTETTDWTPAASPRGSRVWMALAAMFFLGCVGLFLWSLDLRRTIENWEEPQLNTAMADLFPETSRMRSLQKVPQLAVGASQNQVTIILHFEDPVEVNDVLGLRILDSEGHELWRRDGLKIQPGELATLSVPREFLTPGDYVLLVNPTERESDMGSQEYRFRIAWP